MWPKSEDDFMEYGDTGWVALGQGKYKNIHSGFIMDENGIIYDLNGEVVSQIDEDPQ